MDFKKRLRIAQNLLDSAPDLPALPPGLRYKEDANETAVVAKALEYIETAVYEKKYTELHGRDWVPTASFGVPAGAEVMVTYVYDRFGKAKLISNYTSDLPSPVRQVGSLELRFFGFGASYGYSVQDLRSAAMAGQPLETDKAMAARDMIERAIDEWIALGDSTVGAEGFLNSSLVPLLTAVGGDVSGGWASAAPLVIYADLCKMAKKVPNQTSQIELADTMLLAPASYQLANDSVMPNSDKTVLAAFRANNPFIKQVDQWEHLSDADAAGTGPRAVVYRKDPDIVRCVETLPFLQHPQQARGLAFYTPCEARLSPVQWRRPKSAVYVDGL